MDLYKRKKIKFDLVQIFAQRVNIIPIFGDIGYSLGNIYSKCRKFKWDAPKSCPSSLKDILCTIQGRYLKLIQTAGNVTFITFK